jgi:hypothetical protein
MGDFSSVIMDWRRRAGGWGRLPAVARYSRCQVLAGVAVVGLHAWMLSLLPDAGVDKHIPELALLALAISVAIGLAGSWGPVPDTTFHVVVAAPEHVPIVSAEPAVVPDSVRQ